MEGGKGVGGDEFLEEACCGGGGFEEVVLRRWFWRLLVGCWNECFFRKNQKMGHGLI